MYTLYSLDDRTFTLVKLEESKTIGNLRKKMNGLRHVNKSIRYLIYHGNKLQSSMVSN